MLFLRVFLTAAAFALVIGGALVAVDILRAVGFLLIAAAGVFYCTAVVIWLFLWGKRGIQWLRARQSPTPMIAPLPEAFAVEPIRRLIDEGRQLQNRCAQQGSALPTFAINNWDYRVHKYLAQQFGKLRAAEIAYKAHNGQPRERFTGTASADHAQCWNRVALRLEQLDGIERNIVN